MRSMAVTDRRTMIKRAAGTGLLVWTAPVVMDSLVSPAAAVSVAAGCYRAQFDQTGPGTNGCGIFTQVEPNQGTGCVAPNIFNALTFFPDTVTLTSTTGALPGTCTYEFTLPDGGTCYFDARSAARQDQANQCTTGDVFAPCKTITITTTYLPDRFKFIISCGGASCPGGTGCASAAQSLPGDADDAADPPGAAPPWARRPAVPSTRP